jgi:hypothetical protein
VERPLRKLEALREHRALPPDDPELDDDADDRVDLPLRVVERGR